MRCEKPPGFPRDGDLLPKGFGAAPHQLILLLVVVLVTAIPQSKEKHDSVEPDARAALRGLSFRFNVLTV
jgi:hypothetical protein